MQGVVASGPMGGADKHGTRALNAPGEMDDHLAEVISAIRQARHERIPRSYA